MINDFENIFSENWHCADWGSTGLVNFYRGSQDVEMCGYPKEDVIQVSIRVALAHESEDAWGWFDFKQNKLVSIYPQLELLRICFPFQKALEKNKGKTLRLKVERVSLK